MQRTLGYFDKNANTYDVTDSVPVGLGVVLVQEQNAEPADHLQM